MFIDEKSLVIEFLNQLQNTSSPWKIMGYGTEFNYQRGRTDVIIVSADDKVIAIEAKLKKWKQALQQAYRNKCFADLSYVLLPITEVNKVLKHDIELDKRGVGLCSITENGIDIIYEAQESQPLQPWLKKKALTFVKKNSNVVA